MQSFKVRIHLPHLASLFAGLRGDLLRAQLGRSAEAAEGAHRPVGCAAARLAGEVEEEEACGVDGSLGRLGFGLDWILLVVYFCFLLFFWSLSGAWIFWTFGGVDFLTNLLGEVAWLVGLDRCLVWVAQTNKQTKNKTKPNKKRR